MSLNGGYLVIANSAAYSGTIPVNNGAELAAASGTTVPNAVTLNAGATLSGYNGNAGVFSGPINAAGNFTVGLRDYNAPTNGRNLTISGALSGAGNMTIATTASGYQILNLAGANAGYTGTITVPSNAVLRVNASNANNPLGAGSTTLANGGTYDFAPALTTAGQYSGFYGSWYNNGLLGGPMGGFDFGPYTPVANRMEPVLNYNNNLVNGGNVNGAAPPGVNGTDFAGLFNGILNITTAGSYTFNTDSDDGSTLYIDGQQLVASDYAQGMNTRSGTVSLPAGLHTISVHYEQEGGGAGLISQYSGPDTGNNLVNIGSVANTLTNVGSTLFAPTLTSSNAISVAAGASSTVYLEGQSVINTAALTLGSNSKLTFQGLTGLETLNLNGGLVLSGSSGSTFTLTSGTAVGTSNALCGIDVTISGAISGTGATLIKGGPNRILYLTGNSSSSLTGSTFDIQGGILAANSTSALGDATNIVKLDTNSATQGFRATATFATGNTFLLNQAANDIDVTGGNTLTLNSPLTVSANGNVLTKNGNGTLALAAANPPTWTGGIAVSAGAVQATGAASFGTGAITVTNNVGAGFQLNNLGSTLANNVTLNNTGISSAGALESVAGTNTLSGTVTLGSAAYIGADAGSSLALTGTLATAGNALTLVGAGTGTLAGPLTGNGAVTVFAPGGLWNITAANTTFGALAVDSGTLDIGGAGTNATGTVTVQYGGSLIYDDTLQNVNNRNNGHTNFLGAGAITLMGSTNGTSVENFYGITFNRGEDVLNVVANGSGQANLSLAGTAGAFTHNVQSSVVFTGSLLGTAAGSGVSTITTSQAMTFQGAGTGGGAVNQGILPWALAYNTSTGLVGFATANATSGASGLIRPLNSSSEAVANLGTLATPATGNNVWLTTPIVPAGTGAATNAMATNFNTAINSLTLDNNGGLTMANSSQSITLGGAQGGAILALAGNQGISGGIITAGANELDIHTWTGATLNLNAAITGGAGGANAGLTKGENGQLNLNATAFYTGQTVVNAGTLQLNAGTNTIYLQNYLEMGPSATLDLNGTSLIVTDLYNDSANDMPVTGGTVTSVSGTASTLVLNRDAANRQWTGNIAGNVTLVRGGPNTWQVQGNNSYNGPTLLTGGTTILRDYGALSGTSTVNVNDATLTLDDGGLTGQVNRVSALRRSSSTARL